MFHTKHCLSLLKEPSLFKQELNPEKFKSYAVYSESFAPFRLLWVIFWETGAHCMVVVLVSGVIGAFSDGRLLGHLKYFPKKETVNRRG